MGTNVEKMKEIRFNGNEIVFKDAPNKGVAGIVSDQPDELAYGLVLGYNLLEYVQNSYWENQEDAIGAIRLFISNGS